MDISTTKCEFIDNLHDYVLQASPGAEPAQPDQNKRVKETIAPE
jgi:hypothetical protein